MIPLKLSSREYTSTEHYFQSQIREWIENQRMKHLNMNQELKDLFPKEPLKMNRVIEDRKGRKVIVETKTL
jgi:hypothetical protein